MVEAGIGWMARMFDRFDSAVTGRSNISHRFVSPLAELPSFYLRRQVHATLMDDEVGVRNRTTTVTEPLLWSADFPHVEGLYKECHPTVERLTAECTPAERFFFVDGTATEIYTLSLHDALPI